MICEDYFEIDWFFLITMDYIYIVNAFKQQQQQFLLHQHHLQQQLHKHSSPSPLTIKQQLDNSKMSNALIWQPWRDLQQAAAAHHHFYYQRQEQDRFNFQKETRLTSKELPTTSWRRERRLRTVEYHHPHHPHVTQGSITSIARDLSPNSTPPPTAHNQHSPEPSHSGSLPNANAPLNSNAHPISIMMAAAAAASIRPFCESTTNRQSSPVPHQHSALTGQIHHLGQIAHTHVMQHVNTSQIDDAPLDMSYSNLKQRNSPPPPYREPLPGSNFSSSLSRPSVITQAPPKRDKDSPLILNRENDNRSSESIDEHFRRSLGNDYFALFSKNSPSSQSTKTPSPQPQNQQPPAARSRTPPPSSSDQSDLSPPPAYPSNFLPAHHQKLTQQAQSAQITITPKTSSVHLTTASSITMPKHTRPSSPPLPLVVRSVMQPQHQPPLILQKTSSKAVSSPLTSPLSPASLKKFNLCNQTSVFNNSRSSTTSPLPGNQQQPQPLIVAQQQHQQQQQSSATTHFSVIENSPTSSPSETPPVPVLNPSTNLTAIMRIKTEPGLQNVKSHNPTPPSSPTSTTIPSNTPSNYSSNTTCAPSPSSPKSSLCKPLISVTHPSAEILASVDDHFAKALGDTWKKLQESKEMRK